MARCQFSPTSLAYNIRLGVEKTARLLKNAPFGMFDWPVNLVLVLTSILNPLKGSKILLCCTLLKLTWMHCPNVLYWSQTDAATTYITGSNMLRIFRHGVRLFGGEFLRSKGNAVKHSKHMIEYKNKHTLKDRSDFTGCYKHNYLFPAILWKKYCTSCHKTREAGATSTPGNQHLRSSVILSEFGTRLQRGKSQLFPKLSSSSSCHLDSKHKNWPLALHRGKERKPRNDFKRKEKRKEALLMTKFQVCIRMKCARQYTLYSLSHGNN